MCWKKVDFTNLEHLLVEFADIFRNFTKLVDISRIIAEFEEFVLVRVQSRQGTADTGPHPTCCLY